MHEFLAAHQRIVDLLTFGAAAVAIVSLSQLAVALSCVAAVVSIVLGVVRLHDRIRYGARVKE